MDKTETKFIGFRADDELSEAAKRRAKEQHRSLAGYMRYLIEQDLSESTLKEEPPPYGTKGKEKTVQTARTTSISYGSGKARRK